MQTTTDPGTPPHAGAYASMPEITISTPQDRRADVDAKQRQLARIIEEASCEAMLVLDPANFAWLTGGGVMRGLIDPSAAPVLFFTLDGRWLVCSNVDTQRLFDEEVDLLGFQLKEWPWYQGRAQLLGDLVYGRKVACDIPLSGCQNISDKLKVQRRTLSVYEQACYRALGQTLGHALEATCRTLQRGETEREVAGQLTHRLMHRGTHPLVVTVLADSRASIYRQAGYTATPIQSHCVLLAAAQKYGLCALASRTVAFGQPPNTLRRDHDAACRVSATYTASSWPEAMPRQILQTGQRVFQVTGHEHEWMLSPQGHITGRALVELPITLQTEELFRADWAVTWRVSIGEALSCDTFVISEDGPRTITTAENWPLKRIRIQGAEFVRPDLLIR